MGCVPSSDATHTVNVAGGTRGATPVPGVWGGKDVYLVAAPPSASGQQHRPIKRLAARGRTCSMDEAVGIGFGFHRRRTSSKDQWSRSKPLPPPPPPVVLCESQTNTPLHDARILVQPSSQIRTFVQCNSPLQTHHPRLSAKDVTTKEDEPNAAHLVFSRRTSSCKFPDKDELSFVEKEIIMTTDSNNRRSMPLITARSSPLDNVSLLNMFQYLSHAALIVSGTGEIIVANFATYALFSIDPKARPLKGQRIQSYLSKYTSTTSKSAVQWTSEERFTTTTDDTGFAAATTKTSTAARTVQFLQWISCRVDAVDEKKSLTDEEERWSVMIRDVTEMELMQSELRRVTAETVELVVRAFEAKPLRDKMLAGQPYPVGYHNTAIIGFLDIKGSTNYNKASKTELVDYTQKIVNWCNLLDTLNTRDEEVLKLELVGDAYVVAFGLFEPNLIHTPNQLTTSIDASARSNLTEANPTIQRNKTRRPLSSSSSTSINILNSRDAYEDHMFRLMDKALRFLSNAMVVSAKLGFELRAGLHIGSATTCCVGHKMPKLMVIGTPMDVASRLQHSGIPGGVHMSTTLAQYFFGENTSVHITDPKPNTLHNYGTINTSIVTLTVVNPPTN